MSWSFFWFWIWKIKWVTDSGEADRKLQETSGRNPDLIPADTCQLTGSDVLLKAAVTLQTCASCVSKSALWYSRSLQMVWVSEWVRESFMVTGFSVYHLAHLRLAHLLPWRLVPSGPRGVDLARIKCLFRQLFRSKLLAGSPDPLGWVTHKSAALLSTWSCWASQHVRNAQNFHESRCQVYRASGSSTPWSLGRQSECEAFRSDMVRSHDPSESNQRGLTAAYSAPHSAIVSLFLAQLVNGSMSSTQRGVRPLSTEITAAPPLLVRIWSNLHAVDPQWIKSDVSLYRQWPWNSTHLLFKPCFYDGQPIRSKLT